MPRIRDGVTRCAACQRHLADHWKLPLVRCINPHCPEFDRWCQVRPAVPALDKRLPVRA
jgi:hypothetical protein